MNPPSDAPFRAVRWGLAFLAFTIAIMVALGGYVRLSGSGFSIPHWPAIDAHGRFLPPGTEEGWRALKNEYNFVLRTMPGVPVDEAATVAEFKRIFYVEYSHRAMATVVGFAYLFVFVVTMASREIRRRIGGRVWVVGLLILAQAILGGIVVLKHLMAVKVALHLSLAFYLFGLVLWLILSVRRDPVVVPAPNPLRPLGYAVAAAVLLQVFLGGLMAGSMAGYQMNTWPKMGEAWIAWPLWEPELGLNNFNANIALIQFLHRYWAYATVAAVVWLWWRMRRFEVSNLARTMVGLALLVVGIQFVVGVITLLTAVHLHTALTHQMVGLALFGLLAVACHDLKHAPVKALAAVPAADGREAPQGEAPSHA